MIYEPMITGDLPYFFASLLKSYPSHWHSELELHICTKGSFCLEVEEQTYTLLPGDAMVIPSYTTHAIVSSSPDFGRISITFGYALLGNEFKSIQNAFLHIPLFADQTPEALRQPFTLIIDALAEEGRVTAANDWQIRSGLFLLATQLRNHRTHEKPSEEMQNRVQQLDSIYAVLDHVSRHYASKLSVDEAAEIAGYAKTYFCRQFKQATGVSFHRYLNNYRISVACTLLEDPHLSVTDVAHKTGFSSAKLFCRTFKETTGMTTRQYQKLPPEKKNIHWPR